MKLLEKVMYITLAAYKKFVIKNKQECPEYFPLQ